MNGSKSQPKVIAAIPCFNEERFIAEVVKRARKYADQVIVIDDGSTDGTTQVARAAGALVINHKVNVGFGVAFKSYLSEAQRQGSDILVTLDGDGQNNPDEIPKVLAPIVSGEADIVIGSRFLGDRGSMPKYRRFGINVITWLFNIGSKVKLSDAQSCFRAYSKKAISSLNITEKGFGASVQSLEQARRRSYIVAEVPISCAYHPASHSANPVVHGIGVALTVIKLRLKGFIGKC